MKFVIDAQLPRRLPRRLHAAGHDALHTLDLPGGNRTSDAEILRVADEEDRVVVTKDADFVSSFLLLGKPRRLLLVSVGNARNEVVEERFFAELPAIVSALSGPGFLELTRTGLVVHSE
jgi:predicted nuclease of predicted toxin-antitoxin system